MYSVYTSLAFACNMFRRLFDRRNRPELQDGVTQDEAEEAVRDEDGFTRDDSNDTKLCIGSTEEGKILWVAYIRSNPTRRLYRILVAREADELEKMDYRTNFIEKTRG